MTQARPPRCRFRAASRSVVRRTPHEPTPPRSRAALHLLSAYLSYRFAELGRRHGGRMSEQSADFSAAIQLCPDCRQRCPGITHCYYLYQEPGADAHEPEASPRPRATL